MEEIMKKLVFLCAVLGMSYGDVSCIDASCMFSYPLRSKTQQAERDHEKLGELVRACDLVALNSTSARLKGYTKKELIAAIKLRKAAGWNPRPLPRIAFRCRDALACWFVENAPDFPMDFPNILLAPDAAVPDAAAPDDRDPGWDLDLDLDWDGSEFF
jgi:hypothetical protein